MFIAYSYFGQPIQTHFPLGLLQAEPCITYIINFQRCVSQSHLFLDSSKLTAEVGDLWRVSSSSKLNPACVDRQKEKE